MADTRQRRQIENNHEWDPLTEVVVGRWVVDSFRPGRVDSSLKDRFPYIPDDAWTYLKEAEEGLLGAVYPADDQRFHDEQEYLVEVLEDLGVAVRRPDEIPFPTVATTQCYSRDPIITVGDKLIIGNLNFEGRRQETGSYRRIAIDLAAHYGGEVVSMPPNRAGYHGENLYLEGGDVFVDGEDIYVGRSGNATNQAGIEWLRAELGGDYVVHDIPLQRNVLHLDCALMLLNAGQGVVCKEDFVDFDEAPERLRSRRWVEVAPGEAQLMATNGVVVDPQTVLMVDAFPHVAEQVRAMGIHVQELPFGKANYFGGGLRCSYQPIVRRG